MFFPVSGWFAAFVVTLLVEMPIAAWLLRGAEPDLGRRVAIVVLANLVTHPIVWYVLSQVFLIGTAEYALAAEAWAVVGEAIFYFVVIRGIRPERAAIVAVVANVASFAVGRVVVMLSPDVFR
jgi:hypothetical protein